MKRAAESAPGERLTGPGGPASPEAAAAAEALAGGGGVALPLAAGALDEDDDGVLLAPDGDEVAPFGLMGSSSKVDVGMSGPGADDEGGGDPEGAADAFGGLLGVLFAEVSPLPDTRGQSKKAAAETTTIPAMT